MIQRQLSRVVSGESLSRQEAYKLMDLMMEGKMTASQIASLLTSLRIKGETVEELIGFAEGLRKHAFSFTTSFPDLVDTCGTGGDGGKTFNISTATAFVAAAAGVPIAKHGNRAVSSKSGSADVLEALGMDIELNMDSAHDLLRKTGLCFLFAPLFHQTMKYVMPTRKELGFRTCFNLLGPLANPANVSYQLVGIYDRSLTEVVAHVLKALGTKRALVVSSYDGLDEITVTASTQISELRDGQVKTYQCNPTEFGIPQYLIEDIAGGNADDNATLIRRILEGELGAPRDIVLLNAAAVLYLADRVSTIREGITLAAKMIDSGRAKQTLQKVVEISHEVKEHVS